MKLFKKMKDGGAESTVTGYWLCEFKRAFSIVLVKFEGKSREAYHSHAFNCWNWLIKGELHERFVPDSEWTRQNDIYIVYKPSWRPFFIGRDRFHKVDSATPVSWVLSIRGPWADKWKEWLPKENRYRTLTHGRVEV